MGILMAGDAPCPLGYSDRIPGPERAASVTLYKTLGKDFTKRLDGGMHKV